MRLLTTLLITALALLASAVALLDYAGDHMRQDENAKNAQPAWFDGRK